MEFERPNRGNWKKGHKLVGIGLMSKFNSSIICLCFRIVRYPAGNSFRRKEYTLLGRLLL
jgi:hypothetical protein